MSGAPRGFKARDEEVSRERQTLPSGMSDWRYEHISIDPEAVALRATPIEISADAFRLIPDTLGWSPLQIVSSRFKEFLEKEFADGSLFFPFSYRDADTGKTERSDIWFWLPRHYLDFRPQEKRPSEQLMRPQVWGGALGARCYLGNA